jgi:hypothetical protein
MIPRRQNPLFYLAECDEGMAKDPMFAAKCAAEFLMSITMHDIHSTESLASYTLKDIQRMLELSEAQHGEGVTVINPMPATYYANAIEEVDDDGQA